MKTGSEPYKMTVAGARKAIRDGDAESLEKILSSLPDEGGPELQHELALLLRDMDRPEAVTWLQMAIDRGSAEAENDLGCIYYSRNRLPGDMTRALALFKSAADKGVPRAMFNMGVVYDSGHGVKKSFAKAAKWYQKAADAGHVKATCSLGTMYSEGQGVRKDYKKAMRLFRKSARLGNAMAEGNIGWLYAHGWGVKQSPKIAAKWLIRAWEHGWENAGSLMCTLLKKTGDQLFSGEWEEPMEAEAE